MFERLWRMLIKEFIQILRDPRMKGVIILMPIVQALVFGYAVTTDVRNVHTAIYDLDQSSESRELIARFLGSGYFREVGRVTSDREVQRVLDDGSARVVLRFDPGFGAALAAGQTAKLQLLLDGTDSNTAGIVLNYATSIAERYNEDVLISRLSRLEGKATATAAAGVATRAWFNANLDSRNFYVPGVIALIVVLITLMLSSMAVVREKEIGTIEQIMVTPIGQAEFILGKTLPFALIAYLDVALITAISVFWFEVPIRGSMALLLAATTLFLMSTIGIGLLISTVSRTQQQAMMSAFFYYFPAVLLSGFMFPIANMPDAVQWLTYLNPLRYYLVIIRGIFLKGVGPGVLWSQMAALTVLGVVSLYLAARKFHKTQS
ncbi:MAG TPA: ABC transporter permease [Thermoanaerobaculia bacterium]|jgi:ABC-2 type transport system permease protein|nr:ABC transporter permease [Acidobacteriota bacterium]HPA95913.1 ABC transporter permease [Thermoanaerobaculia bacterium]HRR12878.1 ABC transporter permease [Thermoanaerobaculia bacterium]HRS35215.1 ABC transporter permease [Thermoanaerobaculia bacterium]HRU08485.1 ABC transporter permease [Thermoanaerobaculia bacterium]